MRALDRLLDVGLRQSPFGGHTLARLAATLAIEHSGADRGSLLLSDGRSLTPILSLDSNLEGTLPVDAVLDEGIVREAQRSLEPVACAGRLAAPVLVSGRPRGVLYLESQSGALDEWSREIACEAALRIGTLLQSAELVDELSRRTSGMEQLARLGAHLASGQIETQDWDLTVNAALEATRSDQAILARFTAQGRITEMLVRGAPADSLRAQATAIASRLAVGDWPEEEDLSEETDRAFQLLEPLRNGTLVKAGSIRRSPVGFLLVRRTGNVPFRDADKSFLRALAHLISGALARRELFDRAIQDPVTETGTRLALQLGLAEAQDRADKTGQPFSIILADVDSFKEINDRHHHLIGDAVLRGIADVLRSRLRDQDSVSRFGGDEFVIILPGATSEGAEKLANELCGMVARRRYSTAQLSVTLSLGVATYDPTSDTAQDLLGLADEALFSSKLNGRNRATVALRGCRE